MPFLDKKELPSKVLLTGSDCFHLVLDRHAKTNLAGSNVTHIAFYFENGPAIDKIRKVLAESPLIYWMCNIRLRKGRFFFNRPYWQYADQGNALSVSEHHHQVVNEIPENILHKDMPLSGSVFFECDLIYYPGNNSALVLSWNHILMDGRGLGLLVKHLNDLYGGNANLSREVFFPGPEKKVSAYRYIRNMYKVKKFIEDSSRPPIVSVAGKKNQSTVPFRNRVLHFTEEETERISQKAFRNGSKFGANLFYIGSCAQVVNRVNQKRGKSGVLWIPVPYDGRLKGSVGPIISNKVAYLFYRLPPEQLTDTRTTVSFLSGQMMAQIADKMPAKYSMLLDMMRHLPLSLYYYWVNKGGKGSFASFIYSFAGDNFNGVHELFGERVSDLLVFPSPTFPPGLTFFFLLHRNMLNINIVYSLDIINTFELDLIELELRNLLS